MDNQTAIEWIKAISATQKESIQKNSLLVRKEALHMAIQALEMQITIREKIEAWCWKHEQYSQDDLNELMDIVNQLKR